MSKLQSQTIKKLVSLPKLFLGLVINIKSIPVDLKLSALDANSLQKLELSGGKKRTKWNGEHSFLNPCPPSIDQTYALSRPSCHT